MFGRGDEENNNGSRAIITRSLAHDKLTPEEHRKSQAARDMLLCPVSQTFTSRAYRLDIAEQYSSKLAEKYPDLLKTERP